MIGHGSEMLYSYVEDFARFNRYKWDVVTFPINMEYIVRFYGSDLFENFQVSIHDIDDIKQIILVIYKAFMDANHKA